MKSLGQPRFPLFSVDIKLFAGQLDDEGSLMRPGFPNRGAPVADGLFARRAGFGGEDVRDGEAGALTVGWDFGPLFALAGEPHVGQLHLAAGEAFFEGEVEANEGEDGCDGLGFRADVLGGEGVDGVLVEERGVVQGVGVEGELVKEFLVAFLVGGHGAVLAGGRLGGGYMPRSGKPSACAARRSSRSSVARGSERRKVSSSQGGTRGRNVDFGNIGDEAGHLPAVARDANFFALFDPVQQGAEGIFRFKCADFEHGCVPPTSRSG